MAVRFSDLLALPFPAQNPINPLICRSITSAITVAAAAVPTLTRLAAHLHLAVTRECYLRKCPIHAPNDAPPQHTHTCFHPTDLGPAPSPLPPTPHTPHAIIFAMLTPRYTPTHLPASPGNNRRTAHNPHVRRSLPSPTSNGSWVALPSMIQQHYTP
jgi:hypothetical protein